MIINLGLFDKISITKKALAKWGLVVLLLWPILLFVLLYFGIKKWLKVQRIKNNKAKGEQSDDNL